MTESDISVHAATLKCIYHDAQLQNLKGGLPVLAAAGMLLVVSSVLVLTGGFVETAQLK